MQLAGTAKAEHSLGIIQVTFSPTQIDTIFISIVCITLHDMVLYCTVAEGHHSDGQQASQCRVDGWTQPLLCKLHCKH